MAVYKYLDCSTAHVSFQEKTLLENHVLPFKVMDHDYGWWLNVQPFVEEDEEELHKRAPNIMRLIKHALELDCNWINLDADAEELEGFPTFDW